MWVLETETSGKLGCVVPNGITGLELDVEGVAVDGTVSFGVSPDIADKGSVRLNGVHHIFEMIALASVVRRDEEPEVRVVDERVVGYSVATPKFAASERLDISLPDELHTFKELHDDKGCVVALDDGASEEGGATCASSVIERTDGISDASIEVGVGRALTMGNCRGEPFVIIGLVRLILVRALAECVRGWERLIAVQDPRIADDRLVLGKILRQLKGYI